MLNTANIAEQYGNTAASIQGVPPRSYSKDMSLTMAEFTERLPRAVSGSLRPSNGSPSEFVVTDGIRSAFISCEQHPDRRLGSLILPVLRIDIELFGYNSEQSQSFITLFDRSFLRMGG